MTRGRFSDLLRPAAPYADLLGVVLLLVLAVLLLSGLPPILPVALEGPLAVLVAILMPGYAIGAALLPRERRVPERAAVTLGIGLAVPVILALVLNLLPSGIDRTTWIVGFAIITGAAVSLAVWQRAIKPRAPRRRMMPSTDGRWAVMGFGAALLIVVLAFALRVAGGPPDGSAFTQLWAVPVANGSATAIELGVTSHESQAETYRVVITVDETERAPIRITLAPGETWTESIAVPGGQEVKVEATLYRLPMTSVPYRSVAVTVPGSS